MDSARTILVFFLGLAAAAFFGFAAEILGAAFGTAFGLGTAAGVAFFGAALAAGLKIFTVKANYRMRFNTTFFCPKTKGIPFKMGRSDYN